MARAAPARAAYLAAQASAPAPRPRRRGATLWLVGLIVVAAAGAATYAFVIEPWLDRRALLGQSGRPQAVVFGDGVVAVVDAVDVEHRDRDDPRRDRRIARARVTVLDQATGATVARHLFDDVGGCQAAGPGRMWCDLGPLAVHDARTLARLAPVDERITAAGLGRPLPGRWLLDGGTATWALDDGRAALVDAATLTASPADRVPAALLPHPLTGQPPPPAAIRAPLTCDETAAARWSGTPTVTDGDATWAVEDRGGRAALRRKGGPAPSTTFLRPTLLAVVAGAPLFLHHASLEAGRDAVSVSRLGPDGGAAWTVELRGQCLGWHVDGTTLLVVSDRADRRALAIDGATGAVRWTWSP